MKERPTSVTVIAWILIILGGISIITSTISLNNPMAKELMAKSPIPVSAQIIMMYAGLLVSIVSGIGMLKGHNWARLLYVIWGAIGFVISLLTSPIKVALIPGFVVFVIIVFFLFRPIAQQYFTE
jgi:hypothetical protein